MPEYKKLNEITNVPPFVRANCLLAPGYMLAIPTDKLHVTDMFDDEICVEDGTLDVQVIMTEYICPRRCPGCPLDIRLPMLFTDKTVYTQPYQGRIYLRKWNCETYCRTIDPTFSGFIGYMDETTIHLTGGTYTPDSWNVQCGGYSPYDFVDSGVSFLVSMDCFPEHDGYEEEGEC